MKYYSEKTKKLYKTEEELRASEKDFDTQELEKQQQLEVKKDLAKNVEDAYKAYVEAVKAANKIAEEANETYQQLKKEFVDKYGSFHMTYTSNGTVPKRTYITDSLFDLLDFFL